MEIIKKGNPQLPWLYGTCAVCGCVIRAKQGDPAIIPPEMCGGASPYVECPTTNCGATITLNRTTPEKSLSEQFEDFFSDPPSTPPKPPVKKPRVMMITEGLSPKWPPSQTASELISRFKKLPGIKQKPKNELSEEADKL